MRKLTQEEFVAKARLVHGDKYDYSKVEYKNDKTQVCIVCPKLGEFWQRASHHFAGTGCRRCAGELNAETKRLSTEEFIERAVGVHGNKYDYSNVDYKTSKDKVCIICPEHGEFWIVPSNHLRGQGCQKCRVHTGNRRKTKRLVCGFGFYDVPYPVSECRKCYDVWYAMIARCYLESRLQRNPTYNRCSVCEEWKYFSKFKEWFDEQGYRKGYNLDKDILVQGNLVYSPSTCCFVPQYINLLILNRVRIRGQYKSGVFKMKGKFSVHCNIRGKIKSLGTYASEDEAHLVYKTFREAYIREVATEAYNKGEITKEVRDALYKWEIKEY
jgi:hypothetical protein